MIGDCELADINGVRSMVLRVGRDNNDRENFIYNIRKKRYTGYVQIAIHRAKVLGINRMKKTQCWKNHQNCESKHAMGGCFDGNKPFRIYNACSQSKFKPRS